MVQTVCTFETDERYFRRAGRTGSTAGGTLCRYAPAFGYHALYGRDRAGLA
jgi:hypothetical protein